MVFSKITNNASLFFLYSKIAINLILKLQFRQLKGKILFFLNLKKLNKVNNGTFSITEIGDFSPEYLTVTQIAVHIHVHYLDVAKVLLSYLENIPARYDLFVSFTDSNFEPELMKYIALLSNKPGNVQISKVENRGRNVAPLVVEFAQELPKYKYFCHIHTKKSLYSGRERSDWLRYLMTGLLGSRRSVSRIISLFDSYDNIGIIYPETFALLPYWAHTWLSNKQIARDFFQKLSIDIDLDSYQDAPMGTMFWARSQSLESLFMMGLSLEDFPCEAGQNDGTLAHVIERALIPIANASGYTFCEILPRQKNCRIGMGKKNLYQYEVQSKRAAIAHLLRYELVTFDIFDTLLLRPILTADSVHTYVERLIRLKLAIDIPFSVLRREAEDKLRRIGTGSGDITLTEIYEMMKSLSNLSSDLFDQMRKIEVAAELHLAQARTEVVELLSALVMQGKKVALVSDMYLETEDVEALLKKVGIAGYDGLSISSRTGLRKDNGNFWKHFIDNHDVKKHIHIGDNEHSDVQVPGDLGINSYHVMSAKNLFLNSPFCTPAFFRCSFEENVLFGLAANRIFSNPFSSQADSEHKQIKRYDTLGYFVFGPIFAYFIIWLAKTAQSSGVGRLSFLSREGYLLKRLFEILARSLAKKDDYFSYLKTDYLLVSRRATGVASIDNEEDIYKLLKIPFTGSISDLLAYRFGVDNINIDDNCFLDTENEYDKAKNKISQYKSTILANAKFERNSYLRYLKSHENSFSPIESVVDVGYSGTIQGSLEKILERKLTGYYFLTTEMAKSLSTFSCFGQYIAKDSIMPFKDNLLFLECVMLSPDSQLIKFENDRENTFPVFRKRSEMANFKKIKQVQQGIEAYLEDLIHFYSDILFDFSDADPIKLQMVFERIQLNPELVSPSLRKDLLVEDTYTSAMMRRVFPAN